MSKLYTCRGLIRKEPCDDPTAPLYAAYCENLPGVCSQGDTIEEAKNNLCDAFEATIKSYLDDGQEIPWNHDKLERWETAVSVVVEI